jgi:uncharacterized protein
MGQVKTRLAAGIGSVEAVRFFRNQITALLRTVASDPRWQTHIFMSPGQAAVSREFDGILPLSFPRHPQTRGDLGQRMQHTFNILPPGPAVIIGCDIPGIEKVHIIDAFNSLGRNDVVFGPATDGGYWLVGQRRRPHVIDMFASVRWSTQFALQDTRAGLPKGLRVGTVQPLSDVDNSDDFHSFVRR